MVEDHRVRAMYTQAKDDLAQVTITNHCLKPLAPTILTVPAVPLQAALTEAVLTALANDRVAEDLSADSTSAKWRGKVSKTPI